MSRWLGDILRETGQPAGETKPMSEGLWRVQGAFDQKDTSALRRAFVQGVNLLKQTRQVDDDVECKLAKVLIRTLRNSDLDQPSRVIDIDQLVARSLLRLLHAPPPV